MESCVFARGLQTVSPLGEMLCFLHTVTYTTGLRYKPRDILGYYATDPNLWPKGWWQSKLCRWFNHPQKSFLPHTNPAHLPGEDKLTALLLSSYISPQIISLNQRLQMAHFEIIYVFMPQSFGRSFDISHENERKNVNDTLLIREAEITEPQLSRWEAGAGQFYKYSKKIVSYPTDNAQCLSNSLKSGHLHSLLCWWQHNSVTGRWWQYTHSRMGQRALLSSDAKGGNEESIPAHRKGGGRILEWWDTALDMHMVSWKGYKAR